MDMPSPSVLTRSRTIALIGAGSGIGGAHPGAARAPSWLRDRGLTDGLAEREIMAAWSAIVEIDPHRAGDQVTAIANAARLLSGAVSDSVARGEPFAVAGGDHSCVIGTWSGAAKVLRPRGPLGLIWVDAHLDSHVPETTPSGRYHGMPLATLMGHGHPLLTAVVGDTPAVSPAHVSIVGARSYEPEEVALLGRLGVRVFYMDEVEERGFGAVMEEAARIALDGTAALGISIDLDALDPADVPAVSTPEPGGIRAAELIRSLRRFAGDPRFIGCDIVEFNPEMPGAEKSARVIEDILAALYGRQP